MSLYVPLVLLLELKNISDIISFEESSLLPIEKVSDKSNGHKTRRRLMSGKKKPSPPLREEDESHAPLANPNKQEKQQVKRTNSACRGRRAYSEVVMETLEGDKLINAGKQSDIESTKSSKTGSEPPVSLPDTDQLNYYYGNPFVEKTEGILHFFKYNDEKLARDAECRMLCMMAIPAQVTVRDIITFIAFALDTIEKIKIIRDTTPNQYMIILKFKTHNDTVVFFEEFNGNPFNSMESDRCTLLFIDRMECVTEDNLCDWPLYDSLTELPICTVCLERMDDRVLTIMCNHTFHPECLQQWTDSTCPVCRCIQSAELVAEQRCSDCGQCSDLWICLICGNIGCGRYAEGHAYRHFEATSHTFSLQVGGERVWDYAADNFVHRLIQSDSDGKLVEYQRGGQQEIDLEKSDKLEGVKLEYTCLLTSQLDDQRKYFEARLADLESAMSNMEKMSQAQIDDLENKLKQSNAEIRATTIQLEELGASKQQLEKKYNQATIKLTKVTNELTEEKAMNEILRGDQKEWKNQVDLMKKSHAELEGKLGNKVRDMEEQIRDLMVHFDAQAKIQGEMDSSRVTQEEMDCSQIGVTAESPKAKPRRKSKK